jgi:hypothetical protein
VNLTRYVIVARGNGYIELGRSKGVNEKANVMIMRWNAATFFRMGEQGFFTGDALALYKALRDTPEKLFK